MIRANTRIALGRRVPRSQCTGQVSSNEIRSLVALSKDKPKPRSKKEEENTRSGEDATREKEQQAVLSNERRGRRMTTRWQKEGRKERWEEGKRDLVEGRSRNRKAGCNERRRPCPTRTKGLGLLTRRAFLAATQEGAGQKNNQQSTINQKSIRQEQRSNCE